MKEVLQDEQRKWLKCIIHLFSGDACICFFITEIVFKFKSF